MVTSIAGNQADVAIALQSAQGAAAAAAQHRMFLTGGGLAPVKEVADIEETTASRLRSTSYVRVVRADGTPAFVVRPEYVGMLLYGAMGAKSVRGAATVATSSAANPSVITTSAPHGFTSGETVTIAGHSGSTPVINGAHVATVTGPTTFTIPVNVSVGGTGGTATAALKRHTFTLASTLPYLTAWSRLGPEAGGGLYQKYADVKVGQLVIASQAGGLLLATATLMGLGPSWLTAAEVTVDPEIENAFLHADGEGALKVEGSSVASIESSEWSIGNGSTAQQGDSVTPYAVTEGLLDITVKTTQLVTDFAVWNEFIYGDPTPTNGLTPSRNVMELAAGLDFKWTRPSAGGALELIAPRVQVVPDTIVPNVNGDPLKMSVTYRVYEPDSGSGLTAVLDNSTAAYAAA